MHCRIFRNPNHFSTLCWKLKMKVRLFLYSDHSLATMNWSNDFSTLCWKLEMKAWIRKHLVTQVHEIFILLRRVCHRRYCCNVGRVSAAWALRGVDSQLYLEQETILNGEFWRITSSIVSRTTTSRRGNRRIAQAEVAHRAATRELPTRSTSTGKWRDHRHGWKEKPSAKWRIPESRTTECGNQW